MTIPLYTKLRLFSGLMLLLCISLGSSFPVQADEQRKPEVPADKENIEESEFSIRVLELAQSSLMQRAGKIERLAELHHRGVAPVLAALLEGNLYLEANDPPQVIIQRADALYHAISGKIIERSSVELKRIPVTNKLRGQLRNILARLTINDDSPQIRFEAVQRIINEGVNAESIELIKQRQQSETTLLVGTAINNALALYQLQSNSPVDRLEAIHTLRGSLEGTTRNELRRLSQYDPEQEVQIAAAEALDSIASRISFYKLLENIFFGLSLGSVLLLAAIGLAITFGVMGVINMAHGELMMIGAYTTWMVQQLLPNHIAWSLLIAVPSAFVIAGLVGILIERGVIRFLYGRPLETLLATFGISLILQQAARTIFSPLNRSVILPEWMSGSLAINPVLSITYNRLYILVFGLAVFFALMMIIKRTSLGLKVRAVSQNRNMARAVGVRANWVDALTFGLGSGIAGVAGVALSQLTNVGPNLGQAYIIDSFMVVVFGGVGNLWGTLVGAMGLGIFNKFLEPYAGAVLAKVLMLVMLILFIQKRPRGLFPQKGRAAE